MSNAVSNHTDHCCLFILPSIFTQFLFSIYHFLFPFFPFSSFLFFLFPFFPFFLVSSFCLSLVTSSNFPVPSSHFSQINSQFPVPVLISQFSVPSSHITVPTSQFPVPGHSFPVSGSHSPVPSSLILVPGS